ncbi:zf-HC2 domain-containing protein [Aeromicrobium sp.]|uniref:zf-HC2 domain-containing protein n=1 Tax=Aeromicrobium sp. TaxID=1871063 RepID=UPI0019BCD812|nr:zf-HC2 domain-containing protein [Aeromicrobium sp.]MBC7632896.1 zf-HC2 domain-containing protein [Aeromicrobium sp.]
MIHALRTMIECHWSARRIQRHLDADPSAPLAAADAQRLEAHLAVCDRCDAELSGGRGVKAALARFGERRGGPDPARVARLRLQAQRLSHGQGDR